MKNALTAAESLEPPGFQLAIRWLTNRTLPAGTCRYEETLRMEALRKSVEQSDRRRRLLRDNRTAESFN